MTSPSTLIRRARKAKNPAESKRLRAQAAKMRRELRAKKVKPKKAKAKKPKKVTNPVAAMDNTWSMVKNNLNEILYGDNAKVGAKLGQQATDSSINPWLDSRSDQLVKAAKKGDGNTFDAILSDMMRGARMNALQEAEREHTEVLKALHEANSIKVVSAFIAEIEGIKALNRGVLSPTIMVSSFTINRVVAALRDNGYTEFGNSFSNRIPVETKINPNRT
jgi:hypothetical protein